MPEKFALTGISWGFTLILAAILAWRLSQQKRRGARGLGRAEYMTMGFLVLSGLDLALRYCQVSMSTFSQQARTFDWFDVTAVAAPLAILNWAITRKRLDALGVPKGSLISLFALIPLANLLLYLSLCFPDNTESIKIGDLLRVAERDKIFAASLSTLATALLGIFGCLLSINVMQTYGFVLFLFLPFALGVFASLVYGWLTARDFWQCQAVAMVSVLVTGVLLLALSIEGVFCILMALPLAMVLAFFGALLGYFMQKHIGHSTRGMVFCLPLLLPGMFALDAYTLPEPPICHVSTSTVVAAPIERVWSACVSDSVVPRSKLLSSLGINEPVKCTFQGQGRGAVRKVNLCLGTTIVEPIEVWDKPHLLKFSVRAYPPVMRETSPYANLHPLHVDKHYAAIAGQLELTEVAGGTRLTATSWYTHNVWPVEYWTLWSDFLMHQIHKETLDHISLLATR